MKQDEMGMGRRRRVGWWLAAGGAAVFICSLAALLAAGSWVWQNRAAVWVGLEQLPATTLPEDMAPTPSLPEGGAAQDGAVENAGSPVMGRLALIDANRQVAALDGDGGNRRQLTADERLYLFPVWSPDGEQIAVLGSDDAGSGVYVLQDVAAPTGEDAGSLRSLYYSRTGSPFYLYWSPDGQFVTILANHPSGLGLYLAASGGEAEVRLLTTGQPFYWAWSPDAARLLIHTGANQEGARLAFLEPTGEDAGENLGTPGSFQSPGIAPSGQRWAFTVEDEAGARWLVIQNSLGEAENRIPHTGTMALSWSPAADKLAFISPYDGGGNNGRPDLFGPMRLFDAATGQTTLLTEQRVVAFFWSPDGRRLAFLTLHRFDSIEAGIDQAQVRGCQAGVPAAQRACGTSLSRDRLLRPLRQQGQLPELDLWVLDVESGNAGFVTSFAPTPLFVAQFLPFFDQYALSHRLWSPDSSALALPVAQNGVSHIMVIPIDGRRPQIISDGMIAFWRPR